MAEPSRSSESSSDRLTALDVNSCMGTKFDIRIYKFIYAFLTLVKDVLSLFWNSLRSRFKKISIPFDMIKNIDQLTIVIEELRLCTDFLLPAFALLS